MRSLGSHCPIRSDHGRAFRLALGFTRLDSPCKGALSFLWGEADARRLQGLVRGPEGIENRLHGVRDVTLGEDSCRV
jgi:hypothetical protein